MAPDPAAPADLPDYRHLRAVHDTDLPGLLTVELHRPEKLNALAIALHEELQDLCLRLAHDHLTRVVVLTGAGRAFSAGADLADRRPEPPVNDLDRRARASIGGRTCELWERLDQVTIGVVNGLAVGGAVALLACCDLRLAAEEAWFSIPEVELDLPLTWQALPRLLRELGPARTKELVMACDRFTAEQAAQWGFVNHVHPAVELAGAARALAARLLSMDPLTLSMTKGACNALANLLVPVEGTWSDRELLLLAYRQQMLRARADGGGERDQGPG